VEKLILEQCPLNVYNMPMSPVIFVFESLKFKINVNDHNPPHVHIEGGGASVRINLLTLLTLVFMDEKADFSQGTLDRIMNEVKKRKDELMEEWEKYHEKN
jgi:hypothetical protein